MRVTLVLVGIASCCPPMQDTQTPAVVHAVTAPAPVAPPHVTEPPPPAEPPGPPIARTVDVVDKAYGLELPDPYRWMEGTGNQEHATWQAAQGTYAAGGALAKIKGRDAFYAKIRELGLGVSAVFNVQRGGKRLFFDTLPANAQLAKLAVRDADGKVRTLVDPEALSTPEVHVSLNAYAPSSDGRYLSYVISKGGGERGELHVMDVETAKDLPDVIDRIWGEGAATWLPDNKRFFYTQLAVPQEGVDPMVNQVTKLHALGAPVDKDVTVLGRDATATWKLSPEDWPGLWIAPGVPWVIANAGGARSEIRVAVAKVSELDTTGASKTPWRDVGDFSAGIEAAIPHGDRLYLRVFGGAPNRRIVSVPLAKPELAKARIEIPEDPDATLVGMYGARDALYLLHMVDGRARLSRWPWKGKPTPIALPVDGWAPDVSSDPTLDGLVVQIETWLVPGAYYTYDPKTAKVAAVGLASTTTADVSGLVAEEVLAPAPDGTKVPLSIIRKRDQPLDGKAPTILTGYAAYGVSQTPGFNTSRVAWVERGGIAAVCHGRGGGEKGRAWQDGGSHEHKLVGIHDLIACGDYLVAQHYTSPAKLGVSGGSMGGILVGRALTERPDLFAAVHLAVPAVNPLRILAAENGANQMSELGDPRTEAGYKALAAMDPYLHVAPGTPYPAVIFTVGQNDHRVAPWMASKMAARLRVASSSKHPILVRVQADAGHGIGSTRDQGFAERADVWSFFLEQFGEPGFGVN